MRTLRYILCVSGLTILSYRLMLVMASAQSCTPSGYPTIPLGPGHTHYGAFDAMHRYLWVADVGYNPLQNQDALFAVSTKMNALVETDLGTTQYPQVPDGDFSIVYDPVHQLIVMMDQFTPGRWDRFDPVSKVFSNVGQFGGGLFMSAGEEHNLACDSSRGHVLAVASIYTDPNGVSHGGLELVSIDLTGETVLANTGYTLPPLGTAAYTAGMDEFVIGNRTAGTTTPYFYFHPVTFKFSPCPFTSTYGVDPRGEVYAFDIGSTTIIAFRDGASHIVLCNVAANTLTIVNGPALQNVGLPGGAYNSCNGALYLSDLSTVHQVKALSGQYIRGISASVYGLYFDPSSLLAYGINNGISTF